MKIYDLVELIENDEELLSNGIQKGCHGVVINVENNKCEVIFLNSKNQGDYACADIDLKSLKIKGKLPKELQGELDVFIKNLDKVLNKGGVVLFEIGYDQKDKIIGACKEYLVDYGVECFKDISGNDRIVVIKL